MNGDRKKEIVDLFLVKGDVNLEDLNKLNLEDMAFLISFSEKHKEKESFVGVNVEDKILIFLHALKEKIKSGCELYIAYDESTNYPFVDSNNRVWIFSNNNYAVETKKYFSKILLMLNMKKVSGEEVLKEFSELHRLGIEKIILDSGYCNVEFNRNDILVSLKYNDEREINLPIRNPKLQLTMIKYFQLLYSKDNNIAKKTILYKLQENMFNEIIKAKYLLPIQLKESETPTTDESGNVTLQKGTVMEVAILYGDNKSKWLFAFTDWSEFQKVYSTDEWNGSVTSYDDLLVLSKDLEGIIINYKGISYYIDNQNRQLIEKIRNREN